jgi:hypothetical protein
MSLPSGEFTKGVSSSGQLECAITVNTYNPASDTYNVTVEGRIRNVGTKRVTHSTANISCSVDGQATATGSNFGFDLSVGETLTFISKNFNISQSVIGNDGLNFTVHYGVTGTSEFGDNKSCTYKLAVRPAQPGTPVFSNITPLSMTVSWPASVNDGGSPITTYELRRWAGPPGHGPYVSSKAYNLFRNVTGLTPGVSYGFAVVAYNSSGDNGGESDPSVGASASTLAGAWVRASGQWKIALPYIRIGGVWRLAVPYLRKNGVWKHTG